MKPTFQINRLDAKRDAFASHRHGSIAPKIEYFFQAPAPEFSGYRPGDRASFRRISQDYFAREARVAFRAEALVFGLIVIIAALPVIQGIRGLAQFVYGVL